MTDHETELRGDVVLCAYKAKDEDEIDGWQGNVNLNQSIDAYRDWLRADAAVEERQRAYDTINLIHGEAGCEHGDTELVKVIHQERNAMLALFREAQATRSRLEASG